MLWERSELRSFQHRGEVLTYLKKFTYKPGYKFSCWVDEGHDALVLNLVAPVPDSTTIDHKEVSIEWTQMVEFRKIYHLPPDYLMDFVKQFFLGWERHEMQEWLRFEGVMLSDPHADREFVQKRTPALVPET
jgi:hypothetical protein